MTPRRRLLMYLAAVFVALAGTAVVAGPASAATTYSFCYIATPTVEKLNIYNAPCDGGGVGDGQGTSAKGTLQAVAWVDFESTGVWHFAIQDTNCDNVGGNIQWWSHDGVHEYLNSAGCKTTHTKDWAMTDISAAHQQWWVQWGGQNSPTAPFPPG